MVPNIGVILVLYWGLYRGAIVRGLYWSHFGIMEKKMETTGVIVVRV